MQDSSDALIAPSNEQDITALNDKISDLEQIDFVLGAINLLEYTQRRRSFEAWLLTRGYTQVHVAKLDELFDNFNFEDSRRHQVMKKVFLEFYEAYREDPRMQAYFTETDPPARLWQLLCLSFHSIHDKKNGLKENVRDLIQLQKSRLHQQLADAEAKNQTVFIPPSVTNTANNRQPTPPDTNAVDTAYSTNLMFLVAGIGWIGWGLLQILSPKFALFLGVQLSPIMLLFLILAGAAITAYGINRYLTQTTDNETQAATAPLNQPKRCWDYCFKFGGTPNHTQTPDNPCVLPNF